MWLFNLPGKVCYCKIYPDVGIFPNLTPLNRVVHVWTLNPSVNKIESWPIQPFSYYLSGILLLTHSLLFGWDRRREGKFFQSQPRSPLQRWLLGKKQRYREPLCWEMIEFTPSLALSLVPTQLWTLWPWPSSWFMLACGTWWQRLNFLGLLLRAP